jgi:uncharacterized membrane protein (UPF0182 family)
MFIDTPTASGERPVWSLTSTFVPFQRQNLAAIMTVDSDPTDPDDYGTIRLLEGFGQDAYGPGLMFSAFKTDEKVSAATASFNHNFTPLYGNILTLPTADHGLLYLEPVYQEPAASSGSYPVLAHVLVSYDNKIGVGTTLKAALESALSQPPGSPPKHHQGGHHGGTTKRTPAERAEALLAQADRLFTQSDAAGRRSNYSLRESLLAEARAKVARAAALLAPAAPPTRAPSPSASASASASPPA